jgi:hypothetical protein
MGGGPHENATHTRWWAPSKQATQRNYAGRGGAAPPERDAQGRGHQLVTRVTELRRLDEEAVLAEGALVLAVARSSLRD